MSTGLTSAERSPIGRLAEEFAERHRRGEHPSLSEYTDQYPELADEIRELFPALVMLERLKPGTADRTASFADGGPADHRPIERLGDFRILREVGRGGMGVVYEAEQESLGRHVALKVLVMGALNDPGLLVRFRREAKAAARLHHTNIVPVFGVGEHEGVPYYVMQFIRGQGLDEVLRELQGLRNRGVTFGAGPDDEDGHPPEAGRRAASAADIAEALLTGRFARSGAAPDDSGSGVADSDFHDAESPCPAEGHRPAGAPDALAPAPAPSQSERDRPSPTGTSSHASAISGLSTLSGSRHNYWRGVARIGLQVAEALAYAHAQGILHRDVKPSNLLLDLQGTVWVADFGLAKAAAEAALTRTGDVVGTLRYMAPERFRGLSDARGDLYSLGLTLYELCTLRPAFDDKDRGQLIGRVMHEEPTRPRQIVPEVPRDLETIVLKAIERDPARRYRSSGELAEDLRRFLDDRPIRARRSGLPERAWRWGRRNPVVAGLVAAVVLVFFAGFTGVAWKWREADRQRVAAQAINRFLVDDLLSMAAPEMTRGRQVTIQEVLAQAAKKIDGAFKDQPEVKASVLHAIGDVYRRMGLYTEAELLLRRALKIARHTLGPEHEETLRVMISLAWAVDGAGKVVEAESLFSQALAPRRLAVLGPEHPETLAAMVQLAWAHITMEKVPEGEELFRRTLDASRRALGPGHPTTLVALNSLGIVLTMQGKTVEAEPLVLEANSISRRELGPDHPATLNASSGLGELLLARGKAEEAEPQLRTSLDEMHRVLGREYEFSLCTTFALTDSLVRQGKWSQAESLLREQVEIRGPLRARRIDSTMMLISKSADVLRDQGSDQHKLSEAESLYRKALKLTHDLPSPYLPPYLLGVVRQTKARGTGGPIALEVERSRLLEGLGLCLLAQGDAKQAVESIQDSLNLRRSFLPETHAEIGESLSILGAALTENDRAEQAEESLSEGLGILRKALPAGHWWFAASDSFLGACLAAQGRPSEAEPLVLSGYRTLEADRHAPPLMVSLALERVIRLYDAWGKPEKAAEWRAKRPSDGPRPS